MDFIDFYTPTDKKIVEILSLPPDKIIFIDPSVCIGCGLCQEVCPFDLPKKKLYGLYEIERDDLCTECSACKRNCPVGAIRMNEKEGCGCLWDVKNRDNKNPNYSCCN